MKKGAEGKPAKSYGGVAIVGIPGEVPTLTSARVGFPGEITPEHPPAELALMRLAPVARLFRCVAMLVKLTLKK